MLLVQLPSVNIEISKKSSNEVISTITVQCEYQSFKIICLILVKFSKIFYVLAKAVIWMCFMKKVFLKISENSRENTSARFFYLIKLQGEGKACDFIKKEILAQVFSCEFCKIFKNTFFIEHFRRLLLFWLYTFLTLFHFACVYIFLHRWNILRKLKPLLKYVVCFKSYLNFYNNIM